MLSKQDAAKMTHVALAAHMSLLFLQIETILRELDLPYEEFVEIADRTGEALRARLLGDDAEGEQ